KCKSGDPCGKRSHRTREQSRSKQCARQHGEPQRNRANFEKMESISPSRRQGCHRSGGNKDIPKGSKFVLQYYPNMRALYLLQRYVLQTFLPPRTIKRIVNALKIKLMILPTVHDCGLKQYLT